MLEDQQACCFHLFIKDSHRLSLPLCFDVSSSRAGISRMFDRVPLSLSQCYVIETQMFCLSRTQGQTTITVIYMFFDTPAASHLSVFTVLLANLPLFSHKKLFYC